ncbi:MAG: IreB family regulatory phosphoprotein [Clostridium sp.]
MTNQETKEFNLFETKDVSKELKKVYYSLIEKGYNPIHQILGFLETNDPTYITNYNDSRKIITELGKEEIIEELLTKYFENLKY